MKFCSKSGEKHPDFPGGMKLVKIQMVKQQASSEESMINQFNLSYFLTRSFRF